MTTNFPLPVAPSLVAVSSGVDSLYIAVHGELKDGVRHVFPAMRGLADHDLVPRSDRAAEIVALIEGWQPRSERDSNPRGLGGPCGFQDRSCSNN